MLPNLRSGGGRSAWVGGGATGVTNGVTEDEMGFRLIWFREARVAVDDLGDGASESRDWLAATDMVVGAVAVVAVSVTVAVAVAVSEAEPYS